MNPLKLLIFLCCVILPSTCQEITLILNKVGLYELPFENIYATSVVFKLTTKDPENTILMICDQQPSLKAISDLYEDENYGCICDWNAIDTSNKVQQLLFIQNLEQNYNSYPTNTKYTTDHYVFVGVYSKTSTDFQLTYSQIQKDFCLGGCKNNGVCEYNQCQCQYGYFGFDCRYEGMNIQSQNYLMKGYYYILDPNLVSQNFVLNFQQSGNITCQCFAQLPYLGRGEIENTNLVILNSTQLTECVDQSNSYQFVPQFFVIQVQQNNFMYVEFDATENNNNLKTTLIAVLTSCLTLFCCIGICACQYRRNQTESRNLTLMNSRKVIRDSLITDLSTLIPSIRYQEAINKYSSLKEIEECVICLDDFKIDQIVRVTYCYHIFHNKCLDAWLRKNKTCPSCRSSQDVETIKNKVIEPEKLVSNAAPYTQPTELNNEGGSQRRIRVNQYGDLPIFQENRTVGSSKLIMSH